jgi:hypothetical protein
MSKSFKKIFQYGQESLFEYRDKNNSCDLKSHRNVIVIFKPNPKQIQATIIMKFANTDLVVLCTQSFLSMLEFEDIQNKKTLSFLAPFIHNMFSPIVMHCSGATFDFCYNSIMDRITFLWSQKSCFRLY